MVDIDLISRGPHRPAGYLYLMLINIYPNEFDDTLSVYVDNDKLMTHSQFILIMSKMMDLGNFSMCVG